jgi:uncharacterized coiled-coil protein SlyX
MPHDTDEARLLKLEEKVAYQDKTLAELNDVVVGLDRQARDLRDRLAAMERLLQNELGGRDAPHEKPPHY